MNPHPARLATAMLAIAIMGSPIGVYAQDSEALTTELRAAIETLRRVEVIPTGAVIPFDRAKCPSGWEEFQQGRGRVIVGAGQSKELAWRELGDKGGVSENKLEVRNLPSHEHGVRAARFFKEAKQQISGSGQFGIAPDTFATSPDEAEKKGLIDKLEGVPIDNMPPFIVLRYCRKL